MLYLFQMHTEETMEKIKIQYLDETIEKLCALFQCDINDLLELEGTKSKG